MNQARFHHIKVIHDGSGVINMCGRLMLNSSIYSYLFDMYGDDITSFDDLIPNDIEHVFPGKQIPCLLPFGNQTEPCDFDTGFLGLLTMRWGFIPTWLDLEKKPNLSKMRMHLARHETVEHKPYFRDAFLGYRCLVPVAGYYEWSVQAKQKQAYLFEHQTQMPLFLAGIYAWHQDLQEFSLAIITCEAGEPWSSIHYRMPLIIDYDHILDWMSPNLPTLIDNMHMPSYMFDSNQLRATPISFDLNPDTQMDLFSVA